MKYEGIYTPEEAAARMIRGNVTIYNKKTGIVLIPDLVDGSDRENEEFGFRAGNGDWMYGMMGAIVLPEIAEPIIAAEESLDDLHPWHHTGTRDMRKGPDDAALCEQRGRNQRNVQRFLFGCSSRLDR